MSAVNSLVPARFLTITAHLVIVITIFWSRENNVKACLPLDFTQEQYDSEDKKLVTALAITIGMFVIELAGFFTGVSMFNCTQGLLSLAVHCSASVSLSFFVFEKWECWTYWVVFAFCRLVFFCVFICNSRIKQKRICYIYFPVYHNRNHQTIYLNTSALFLFL
uniref:Transmembrane protein 107 n=1 Tax=Takifugu rubripes TaxID=31033 RepID=A0A674MXZ7_TAKRU